MRTEHRARHGLGVRKGVRREVEERGCKQVRKGKPGLPKCHRGYFVSCQKASPLLSLVLRAFWVSPHAPQRALQGSFLFIQTLPRSFASSLIL